MRSPLFHFRWFKLKQHNHVILQELSANRPADHIWETPAAKRDVVAHVREVQTILAPFRLNWKHIVRAAAIYAKVDLIRLYLANARNIRAQVVLQ